MCSNSYDFLYVLHYFMVKMLVHLCFIIYFIYGSGFYYIYGGYYFYG